MLGEEREEGRDPGSAEGPTSSLPRNLWDLTRAQAERLEQKDASCVRVGGGWGHVRRAYRCHCGRGGHKGKVMGTKAWEFQWRSRARGPRDCFWLVVPVWTGWIKAHPPGASEACENSVDCRLASPDGPAAAQPS